MLVLASASPRRLELLGRAGLRPIVWPADVDEAPRPGEPSRALAARLAAAKADLAAACHPAAFVVAADTVVCVDGEPFGKPEDRTDAERMLGRLSGRAHEVITATSVVAPDHRRRDRLTTTRVTFRPLGPRQLAWYLGTGEWADKAGAYAVQGAGAALVTTVEGSYTSVVGLPLAEVLEDLEELGYGC